MLLWLSRPELPYVCSTLAEGSSPFQELEDASSDMALEAALDLAVSLAFLAATSRVALALLVEDDAGDDDRVQGAVELPVAGAVESMTNDLARRGRDGCNASQRRERSL